MKTLAVVSPADLAAVWPRLRADMASIESPDGWLPEDVYCAVKTGGASLRRVLIDDAECGFLVLRALNDPDGPRLHIWLLFSSTGADLMAEFSDQLDELARSINARRITFSSTRSGWAKVAPKHGFRVREIVYERNLTS